MLLFFFPFFMFSKITPLEAEMFKYISNTSWITQFTECQESHSCVLMKNNTEFT